MKWVGIAGNFQKSLVSRIYVIRRKLTSGNDESVLLAHSALFCQTDLGYFIIEYLDDSRVYISGPYEHTPGSTKARGQGHGWQCQEVGTDLNPRVSLKYIGKVMEGQMNDQPFNLAKGHISHKAQELTRMNLNILNRSITIPEKINITYSRRLFPT